jgi:hypothetical protein
MNQGMGILPSNVAARADWLVARHWAVEKNWTAR